MITAACFLAVLLILGYVWHRREQAHDAEHTDLRKIIAAQKDTIWDTEERCDVLDNSANEAWENYYACEERKARLVIALDNARADLAEKVRACAAETERMDRRYWMPTLDGIRADSRDNPPDAVALAEQFRKDFEAAEVVPIKGKGAKR